MFKDKYAIGKDLRSKTHRSEQAMWKPSRNRPSVKQMIELSNYDRLPDLIPVRHFRMSGSPFVFYRATASIMARDLSSTPSSGITVQTCGDCHLMNFGGFATPERHIVMDINDFDETLPGPWEWDVKRLAASFALAGREKNLGKNNTDEVVMELIAGYQNALNDFANMSFLDLWYLKFDLEEIAREQKNGQVKERLEKTLAKGRKQTHDKVFYKMTSDNMGKFSITEQPPLILHPFNLEESMDMIRMFFEQYKGTMQPDRRLLFDQYTITDAALKVVGVGSVGTRCYIALMLNDNKEPLFLQVKEARQSVLEPYTKPSEYQHHGERIVQGQRLMQSASDIFLGWTTGPTGRHFYVRQLRDKKIAANVETMNKDLLTIYARFCGRVLAKAHCKTNQGAIICGYIGKGDNFAKSVTTFANLYADQTEKDFEEFTKAIRSGELSIAKEFANESVAV
jgi:uncharacterized protein (DUF2252 family)